MEKTVNRSSDPITWAIVAVWVVAVAFLFIADVHDETSGLVVFGNPAQTSIDIVRTILKTPLPFWRPVPTIFAALLIHAFPPEVSWRLLRIINILLILGALAFILRALREWDGPDDRRDALFAWTYLMSGGAIIVGTWFANIFDASAMLLIAWGLLEVARKHFVAAGVIFGAAFFCKEAVAMVLPLLLLLMAIDRLSFRDAVRIGVPTVVFAIVYFALRSLVVPFGSAADTHQFHLGRLTGTAIGFVDTYWLETMWWSGPRVFGFLAFAFSLVAMRGWRARLAFLAYVAFGVVMYLEMFDIWQNYQIVHYLMFIGRLYFIPVSLTLFVYALDRRWWALPVLALPLLLGAIITFSTYVIFQRSYRNIYAYAKAHGPVRIYFPMKPLHDPRRGIEIGDLPDAKFKIDPVSGKLLPLDGAGGLR